MIELDQNLRFNEIRQHFHVADIPGLGIGITGDRDNQLVIMTVIVRIAALAEDLEIPLIRPFGHEQPMSGIKRLFTGNGGFQGNLV